MFCVNMYTLKAFKERRIKHDIMNEPIIPEYCDRTAANPLNKWDGPEMRKLLLDHW